MLNSPSPQVVVFTCSVLSESLGPQGPPHTRLPCPWLPLGVCSNLCPLMMPSNHLILCRPLFLLPSVFPSIGVGVINIPACGFSSTSWGRGPCLWRYICSGGQFRLFVTATQGRVDDRHHFWAELITSACLFSQPAVTEPRFERWASWDHRASIRQVCVAGMSWTCLPATLGGENEEEVSVLHQWDFKIFFFLCEPF